MIDSEVDAHDFCFVVLLAVRSALPAKSHAPGVVVRFVRAHWAQLDDMTQTVLMRDIEEHLRGVMHPGQEKPWRGLRDWIAVQWAAK